MLLVVRLLSILGMLFFSTSVAARNVHILIIGSNTVANCSVQSLGTVPGVYQIGLDEQEKIAADPIEFADCDRGNIWIPLGKAMIQTGFATKVMLVPVGVSGAGAVDWLPGGKANARLASAVKAAAIKGLDFNYAFWQPAESDNGLPGDQYKNILNSVIKMVGANTRIKKWIIARRPNCDKKIGAPLENADACVVANPLYNRFDGPSRSDIGSTVWGAGGVLNAEGQRRMAQAWLDSIKKADLSSDRYQKESLLYYFRWQ